MPRHFSSHYLSLVPSPIVQLTVTALGGRRAPPRYLTVTVIVIAATYNHYYPSPWLPTTSYHHFFSCHFLSSATLCNTPSAIISHHLLSLSIITVLSSPSLSPRNPHRPHRLSMVSQGGCFERFGGLHLQGQKQTGRR